MAQYSIVTLCLQLQRIKRSAYVPTFNAAHMLQVHRKRFAVLTRFVDELEASLNPEEMHVVERNKAGAADQSDRDSSERSMQG